jgi:hypothetical protein
MQNQSLTIEKRNAKLDNREAQTSGSREKKEERNEHNRFGREWQRCSSWFVLWQW